MSNNRKWTGRNANPRLPKYARNATREGCSTIPHSSHRKRTACSVFWNGTKMTIEMKTRVGNCHGLCERYRYRKQYSYYLEGAKCCLSCQIFIKWEGRRCPCCSGLLRTRPRNQRNKFYERAKEVQGMSKVVYHAWKHSQSAYRRGYPDAPSLWPQAADSTGWEVERLLICTDGEYVV